MISAIQLISTITEIMRYGLWVLFLFCIPKAIHIFQQESYQVKDYFRWIFKNPKQAFGPGFRQFVICVIAFMVVLLTQWGVARVSLTFTMKALLYYIEMFLFYSLFYIITIRNILCWKKEREGAKKKLVYTARVKRLIFYVGIAVLLLVFCTYTDYSALLTLKPSFTDFFYTQEFRPLATLLQDRIPDFLEMFMIEKYAKPIVVYSFLILTMPIVLIIGAFLAMPTETLINEYYITSAQFKILRPKYKHLIRIGITGSYGKTSTKFILKTILSEKYNVLATPESYNTTMGNVKIIRKELKPEHEVFISEMGARYRGDIRKICRFVYPQIGIITSIGEQHLETFKTIERVAKTKAELLEAIPRKNEANLATLYSLAKNELANDQCAIFLPSDGAYCSQLFENETERNKLSFGLSDKKANVYAKNIKLSSKGCEFTAVTSIGEIKCVSKLLGEFNIQNILGAIAVAVFLGLSKDQIAKGVAKIEPIEHRLQLLPNANGSIVIDDAFNSNPVGSKMALDVLKSFEGRKIVITPGMVELGEKETDLNRAFGKHMAHCTDIAILIGVKRSKPIEEGLKEEKFDKMNIFVVANLTEATKKLGEITQPGDVILFENDLPDNYNE